MGIGSSGDGKLVSGFEWLTGRLGASWHKKA